MIKLTQLPKIMQRVLDHDAYQAGLTSGFVQRQSKLSGATYVQTLVFGWLGNPQASLVELAQTASALNVEITPQGLDQRFTESAATCLRQVLTRAIEQEIASAPVAVPIWQRFQGVNLDDSSIVRLPDELAEIWPGCGGSSAGLSASVKLEARLDLLRGQLFGPYLQDGRKSDQRGQLEKTIPAPGSLWLGDLGYFNLDKLSQLDQQGCYWVTRIQAGTTIVDQADRQWALAAFLRAQKRAQVDVKIKLGARHQLPCRIIAVPASPAEVHKRRQQIRDFAARHGYKVSSNTLAAAAWTYYVTNAPTELLSFEEVLVVARSRWQIELTFKLWKSLGYIDEWRSNKPARILCELYAKLLAMVILHWVLITSCWRYPDRSLFQAAKTVQKLAFVFAFLFNSTAWVRKFLKLVEHCLANGCRIDKRKKHPAHFQLLLNHSLA